MLPLGENSSGLPSGLQPLSGMIPLSTLIEFMLQRTYHELTIMAELLPRKTDMERKIEISEFASRTRQMFVRLLALVKWANSVSKVEKCARMSTFLDQQQELFMETADSLARMARETLVHARLPSFALPCAVDVLTTGTYPRLPFCIKEKIVPPDLITPAEKKQTLERLTQIIEYRIVTSDLPAQMCNPKIGNGRVKFTVEHEFEVTLTLMGDDPNIPWRLLDIEVLVEDPETGSGQSLVHSLQVNYIHQLVQSRLMDNEKPLHELYDCLHAFCQSLQLEVLHSQAQVLIHQRGLGDSLKIEKYEMGRRLCISYWRDPIKKEGKPYQPGYKLEVHVDSTDKNKPLQLSHFPQVQGSESIKVPQAIKSDCLSLEKFFVNTIQVRSLARLKDLERELRLTVIGQCEIKDLPVVLYIPLLMPCLESEKLSVTVDTIRGCYLVSLAQKETPLTHDIEECLNSDKKDLKKLLTNLRYWLMLERCRQSLQQMPVECHDELPFVNVAGHRLEALGKHCLYIRLPMQLDHYLVVEVVMPVEKGSKKPFYSYYLLKVHPEGIDTETTGGNATDASSSGAVRTIDATDLTQLFLRPGQILKLDPFALTRGQCGKVMDFESDDPSHLSRKRKLLMGGEAVDDSGGKLKRPRVSTYFISELTHIVALCEDKLPLVALAGELAKRGIAHTGITVEGQGVALSLSLLQGLPCPDMPRKAAELLKNNLLSFTFRIQRKDKAIWCIENIFTNHPIKSMNIHEQGPEQRVFYYYDKMSLESIDKIVTRLVSDWNAVCQLFAAVVEFSEVYNSDNPELMKSIEIRSYNYKHLNLAYGPQKCYMVSVQYNQTENQFKLLFGTIGQSPLPNCHTLVSTYLEKDLNNTKSVAHLSKVLVQTCSVLMSICKLSTSPIIWIKTKMLPVQMFTILPVSSVHFRIVYRSSQCLDIQCVNAFEVSIRDGAYSVFDTSRFIEGLAPIYGLQSFLSLFVDDSNVSSQARRRMTADDDNPLSPVVTDPMDAYLASSNPPSSQRNMLIAPSPSNIMSPSPGNPALLVPSSPSSFVPVPSPGSLGMHMPSPAAAAFMAGASGMVDGGGSPFPGPSGLVMPSPAAARNWPNSPMVHASPASRMGMAPSPGHPSLQASPSQHKDMDHAKMAVARMFPQRPWATLVPTILSHEALDKLLTPVAGTSSGSGGLQCSPLERFLGCTFLKRHMLRIVSSDEAITNMQVNNEPGVVMFKFSCGLQCRVFLNPTNLQSLCLKVAPVPEVQNQWDSEELAILEKFFEMKVDCEPYKPNALLTFAYILKAPMHILKDFIQIMRMEIMPDRNLKWSVQWCMLIPFGFNHISPVGSVAVTVNSRILFMLQLSRNNNIALPPQQQQQQPPPPPSCEPQSIIVPILYDTTNNVTSTIEQKMMNMAASSLPAAVSQLLKNCMEFQVKPSECSILPCVRELITNLNF